MANLEGRILDLAVPYRTGMDTFEGFWDRSKGGVGGRDKIKTFMSRAEQQGLGDQEKARLERIAKEEFDKHGKEYFKGSKSKYVRYGALGAHAVGAITAGAAIFALAAGAPYVAMAGIAKGLGWILGGAVANTGADLYDNVRMQHAISGKESEDLSDKGYIGKALGYLKKGAQGVWETVKSPFKKESAKPLGEGLAENVLAYKGSGWAAGLAPVVGTAALPYVQAGALAAGGALAYHRGGKKFDDQLVKYIHDRIENRLIKENENVRLEDQIEAEEVTPLTERLQEVPDYTAEPVYAMARQSAHPEQYENNIVKFVPPRSQSQEQQAGQAYRNAA